MKIETVENESENLAALKKANELQLKLMEDDGIDLKDQDPTDELEWVRIHSPKYREIITIHPELISRYFDGDEGEKHKVISEIKTFLKE